MKRYHRRNGNIHGRNLKFLEHYLGHFLPIGLGIVRCFGEEHGKFLGIDMKLVMASVIPDLFDVIPIGNEIMLINRVIQCANTTPGQSFTPKKTALCSIPACGGRATAHGKTVLGVPSPAKPTCLRITKNGMGSKINGCEQTSMETTVSSQSIRKGMAEISNQWNLTST
ncbi:hypothetical protein J1N35_020159 [Gossypium stocksii]|uniref:Uncharacterized protein n=1 Tax=Gossypium stocksii TaxID=47602 RepID=A0A9D3VC19_9ROSI|nr:hypothetical protein J1N35_020159 [Gossypium stocksii]